MVEGEECILVDDALAALLRLGKSVKLNLKENIILIDKALDLLRHHTVESADLWFNGKGDVLQKEGGGSIGRSLSRGHHPMPYRLSCPHDHQPS